MRFASLFILIAVVLLPVSSQDKIGDLAAELPRIPPTEAKDAVKKFKIAPGFRIELVASEPLIRSPVAIDFDEDGRLYVCEFPEYNLQDDPTFKEKGAVKRLEDTDGDGVYDKATVFADNLPAPCAVACWDGGVFIGAVPNLHYMKDTDGDGKADLREIVYSGFDRDKAGEGMLNSIRWGLDNRFHLSTSSAGGSLRAAADPKADAVNVRGRFVIFDPRTRRFETTTGHGQHGMSMDDWGNTFVCDNSNPIHFIQYDGRYAARNPYVVAPPVAVNIHETAAEPKLFRTSSFEPWRIVRTRLRQAGLVKGPLEGGRVGGHFTGATGVTFYRGDAFPPECREQAFVGEVSNNLVHRMTVTPKGLGFTAKRTDATQEFLASSDNWFRPCQMANGPDGCLYIVDMYRELIETTLSIPPEITKHLDPKSGIDRGRIWRIVPENFKRPPAPRLSKATTAELVALLDHPNGWHRDTASRLLYQRQDRQDRQATSVLTFAASTPQGRVHILGMADGLDWLNERQVLRGMDDGFARVREHAVRLAERFADRPAILAKWTAMIEDPDERVRRQVAFSLGASPSAAATDALARLADVDDRWMRFAIMTSSKDRAGVLSQKLLADPAARSRSAVKTLLLDLATAIGLSNREGDVVSLLKSVESLPASDAALGRDVTTTLLAKLPAAGRERLKSASVQAVLKEMLDEARKTALDSKRSPADRAVAARNLRLGRFDEIGPIASQLLQPTQPEEVQKAMLDALAESPAAASVILDAWPTLSPSVRSVAAETLLSRPASIAAFFDRIERGTIKPSEIDPARIALLRQTGDPALKARTEKLFAGLSKRGDVLAAYKGALDRTGDVDRGRALFRKHCTACHRRESVGEQIGADLAGIGQRGPEFLLVNILDPNREVLPKFLAYQAQTDAGRSVTGMIQTETATSLTIRRPDGTSETILRANLESLRSTGMSFMPEGFEKQMSPAEMADLIAYLVATP